MRKIYLAIAAAVAVVAGSGIVRATTEVAPWAIGINMSGAEYSWGAFPGTSDLDYLRHKGIQLVRLPIAWERIQPTLNGSLEPAYLEGLKSFLSDAALRGIEVIVDLHNYGRYDINYAQDAAANYGIMNSPTNQQVIGSPALPISDFANFWRQLATALNGRPGVAGYDIMNEPYNMGNPTVWPQAAQAAVNAIRSVDTNTTIYVGGDNFSSAASWLAVNRHFHITDPANNLVYEAHLYFDSDGSGRYLRSYTQQGAYPNIGVDKLRPFLRWLKKHNYKGFLGEFAVPNNDPLWLPVLDNFLNALQAARISGTYWNYTYHSATDPSWWPVADNKSIMNDGNTKPQVEILFAHTAPTITAYSRDSDTVGNALTDPVRLTLTGRAAANSTVHIYDGSTLLGTAKADATGNWAYTTMVLSIGAHNFTSTCVNAAGTTSNYSSTLSVTVMQSTPNWSQ